MNVLLIHNKYKIPGGEDSVVQNESTLLKQCGHEVDVLYFTNDDINSLKDKVFTGLNSIYSRSANEKTRMVVEKFKPDVIHVHNTFPKISPSIFDLANELKIPIVQTIHNYRLVCPGALLLREEQVCEECVNAKFAYKSIKNKCYRNSAIESTIVATVNFVHNTLGTLQNKISRFIVLSDFAKQKLKNSTLQLSDSHFAIKPNFVEDKDFNHNRQNVFLFVGRLSTEKGLDVLLEAFSQTSHPLAIIGGGPLEAKVMDYASKHSNIEYLGFQSSDVVIEKMKHCKALVFPSIWYEGMPMTILEAFSTGCPVIASKLGAMEELIEHEINGLHFEAASANDLIKQLDLITDDMSLNARNSYLEHYTPEANYKQLIDIYQKVIDENSTHH
jgi:glycosyltransferase involved in cell wall biosynthesis